LANTISTYLQQEKGHLSTTEPGYRKISLARAGTFGKRLGRPRLRATISIVLILWFFLVIGFVAVLALSVPTIDRQIVQW
jgi:hypothetical protein